MTPDSAEKYLQYLLRDFDMFSFDLIGGKIPEFAPPFESYSAHHGSIISYLYKFFNSYLESIREIQCLDLVNLNLKFIVENYREQNGIPGDNPVNFDLYQETESVCKMILDSLRMYFKGFPAGAFNKMENVLKDKNYHLTNLLPQIHHVAGSNWMYRVRKGLHTDAKELFHVPFDRRQNCLSYRFSIAGVPALYSGASLKTALLETGIKTGDEISAAIFSYRDDYDFKFIDLTIPKRRDYGLWERYSMVLFYPLILACGLKVKEPDSGFKPEYIIPQLFYQYIRNNSDMYDGIIYNSTRYINRDFSDQRQSNYVVFTHNCDAESGQSKALAYRLQVHGPYTFKYLGEKDIAEADNHMRDLVPHELIV